MNWAAPAVEEQMNRDGTLLTLGKGAVFVPCFSEPRREPEVAVYSRSGRLAAVGQTGHRILLDSGTYELQFGSGVTERRLRASARVEEGHTTVVAPTWGALLVETLLDAGAYIDGQYELLRMERWVNYGRGAGFKDERLQDIKVWVLPPGLYRLSKVGESYNSLRNYITVQINSGELHSVELVFDKEVDGNLIAGGAKSLNTRTRVGRHWTYGLRAGGNLGLTQEVDETALHQENVLLSTDLRTRARYDRPSFFGINEFFLQDGFLKDKGKPINISLDDAQLRSTWVRRLNAWVGPYVRGQASTHLFPNKVTLDTVYRVRTYVDTSSATRVDSTLDTSGSFRVKPSFFPVSLAEGAGVNLELLTRYELELSTQLGLAAHQQISMGDYVARTSNTFEKSVSSYSVGVEGILTGKLRLSTRFTLDLRAEIFAENAQPEKIQLQESEADFRLFLSRNVELGYLFQISERLDQVANRYPRKHSLSLRLSFNY